MATSSKLLPATRERIWFSQLWLAGLCASALRRRRRARADSNADRTAVIVPPASPGGLGDEAMMTALSTQLTARGFSPLLLATWQPGDAWKTGGVCGGRLEVPRSGIGGWLRFARRIRGATAVCVIGADMLDGYYGVRSSAVILGAAHVAARLGVPSVVTGCSYSGDAPSSVVRLLRRLPPEARVLARDEYSQRRLETVRGRSVPLVADIAFLLRPAISAESPLVAEVRHWVRKQREAGARLVLGCNLNTVPWRQGGYDVAPLIHAVRATLERLAAECGPLSLVMLPHDPRPPWSDVASLGTLNEMLPAGIERNTVLLNREARAGEVKAITAECDLILAGRMHLAIASLGSGVPVACVGYQGKYEGLFRHFGLEEMVVDWREVAESGRLSSWFTPFVSRRQELARRITERLPHVVELARKGLQDLPSFGSG
jgi:polysaccharide pyruvyl transferase WcaK-like protein